MIGESISPRRMISPLVRRSRWTSETNVSLGLSIEEHAIPPDGEIIEIRPRRRGRDQRDHGERPARGLSLAASALT